MKMNITKQLIMGVLMVPMYGFAADYYVKSGGTGTGSSWANAAGNPTAAPAGSTIYVAGGNYKSWNLTGKTNLVIKRATSLNHGSDLGWSAAYDSKVFIGGDRSLGCLYLRDTSSITIDGQIKNGIQAAGCYHSITAVGNNLTFRYLELGGEGDLKNDEDGIQGSGNNLLVEHCSIHGNDNIVTHGDGIQWFDGTNVTLRYNIFKNNGQQMMLTETVWGNSYVNNLQVYYNVFFNRGGDHYNGISKKLCPSVGYYWYFYNNTFDLEAPASGWADEIFSGAGSCMQMIFRNNAVVYSRAGSLGNVTHSHNAFDNSGTDLVYSIPSETGRIVAADLGFVDASTGDYRLKSTSPLIGKGTNVGLVRDIAGNPVPANPSIGAYEYVGSSPTPAPVPSPAPAPAPTPTPAPAPAPGGETSSLAWSNFSFAPQISKFEAIYDAIPNGANIDALTGLSNGAASGYASLAAIVRFNSSGAMDARNGANYEASASLNYTAGQSYRVRMVVDMASRTYDVYVTPAGGSQVQLARAFAFRSEQASVTQLNNRAIYALSGSHTLSNFAVAVVDAPPSVTAQSLMPSLTPKGLINSDGAGVNYELGMRFKSTVAGKITHIRFYKSSAESGTHVGKIYSSTGTVLAQATFTSESGSGWQQVALATPLSIAASTEYTVSVNTGNTYYVITTGGMASQISSTNLRSVVGNNGVYGTVGRRPTSSWNNSNYFRDVVFVPN